MSSPSPQSSQNKKIRLGQKKLNVFARKAKPKNASNSSSSYISEETGSIYHQHFQPQSYQQNSHTTQNSSNSLPFQTQHSSSGGTSSSSHPNVISQSPTLNSRREMIRISASQGKQQPQELPLRSESSMMMSNNNNNNNSSINKKDKMHSNQLYFSSSNNNSIHHPHKHQIQKRIDSCSKISGGQWYSQNNPPANHAQQKYKNQSYNTNNPDNHVMFQHNKELRASIQVQQKDINELANISKFQQQHNECQSNKFYSINSPPPPLPKSQNTSTSRKKYQINPTNRHKKIANIQTSQRQSYSTNQSNAQSPMHRSLSQPRNFIAHQFGRSNQHNNSKLKQQHQQQQQQQQQQPQQPQQQKSTHNYSYKLNQPHSKSQSQHITNRRIAFQIQKRAPPAQNISTAIQDIVSPVRKFGQRQSQSDSDGHTFFTKIQNQWPKMNNRQTLITQEREMKSKSSQQDLFQSNNGRLRIKGQKPRKSVGLRKTPSNSKLQQQNSIILNTYNQGQKRGLLESRQSKFNKAIQPKNQSTSRTKTHLKSVFNNSKEPNQSQSNNNTISSSVAQSTGKNSLMHNFQFQTHQQQSNSNIISHPHHSYVKKIQNSQTSRPSGSLVKSVGKIRESDITMQNQNYVSSHTNNNTVDTRSMSPNSRKKLSKHRSKTSFTKDQSLSIQNGTHLMMSDIESIVHSNHQNDYIVDTPKVNLIHTSKARRPSEILSFQQDYSELRQQIVSGLVSTTSKKSEKTKFSRQNLNTNKNISQPGALIYPGSTKASRVSNKEHGQHLLPDIPSKPPSIIHMNAPSSNTNSSIKATTFARKAGFLQNTPLPETNFTTQSKRKFNNIKIPSTQVNNNSDIILNFRGGNNISKDLFGSRQIKTPRTNTTQKIESNIQLQRSESINVPPHQQHYQHHNHHSSVSSNILQNSSLKSQNLLLNNRKMPSFFGDQIVRQPSYPQTTKNQMSQFSKNNINNNSAIAVQQRQDHEHHHHEHQYQQKCSSMGGIPFSMNSTLAACEPSRQAGLLSQVLGKTSMGGSGTKRFEPGQVNSIGNRLTSISNSPISYNQRKLRKQKEYLAKNVNIILPKQQQQLALAQEQTNFQSILGGSHYVSQHRLDTQEGSQQQLEQNRIDQAQLTSITSPHQSNLVQKQNNLISLKSIISPNNGAKAVETIHQENQGDSQFSTLIRKSLHKSLSNNNGLHSFNFQTFPNQSRKNVQEPKINSIPESFNTSIEQNIGGASSSVCSSH